MKVKKLKEQFNIVGNVFTGKTLRKVFFLIKRSTFLIETKAVMNTQHLVTVRHHRQCLQRWTSTSLQTQLLS